MLLGRNSKCWCGSGEKYKKCHMEFDEKLKEYAKAGYQVPTRDMIKNAEQIEKIKESAKINTAVLDEVAKHIKPGMTTEEINTIVHNFTVEHGAIPAPLGYGGFPKSVCTSINDQICHGIPSEDDVLKEGDIVNVDVSTIYNGYYSDASRMFKIGEVSEEADRLVRVTKECMEMAIANVKPWIPMGIIGATIQEHAHKNDGVLMVPGMTFTIEPMINEGGYELYIDQDNEWTSYTDDGKLSAQWENMILVTEDGCEILTY